MGVTPTHTHTHTTHFLKKFIHQALFAFYNISLAWSLDFFMFSYQRTTIPREEFTGHEKANGYSLRKWVFHYTTQRSHAMIIWSSSFLLLLLLLLLSSILPSVTQYLQLTQTSSLCSFHLSPSCCASNRFALPPSGAGVRTLGRYRSNGHRIDDKNLKLPTPSLRPPSFVLESWHFPL